MPRTLTAATSATMQRSLAVTAAAWAELTAAGYDDSCCIAAARVISTMLTRLGRKPKVHPVTFVAFSPEYARRVQVYARQNHGKFPPGRLVRSWMDERDDIYSVAIDPRRTRDGRYPGHVVTTCDGVLLDPSVVQASRPQFALAIGPLVMPHNPDWPRHRPQQAFQNSAGVSLIYHRLDNADDWRTAPDWNIDRATPMVDRALARLADRAE